MLFYINNFIYQVFQLNSNNLHIAAWFKRISFVGPIDGTLTDTNTPALTDSYVQAEMNVKYHNPGWVAQSVFSHLLGLRCASPPRSTFFAGLSPWLGAWGTPIRQCQQDQAFFCRAANGFPSCMAPHLKMALSHILPWWKSVHYLNITTPDQSGLGSNGNEGILHFPQSSKTGASPS